MSNNDENEVDPVCISVQINQMLDNLFPGTGIETKIATILMILGMRMREISSPRRYELMLKAVHAGIDSFPEGGYIATERDLREQGLWKDHKLQ